MQTGISLYFGDGVEKNEETIERARRAGARLAFTSMHIPEEEGVAYRDAARHLLGLCRDAGIDLMVDVSPVTLEKLGFSRIEDLLDFGVTLIRLDFGFDAARTVELSRHFRIVFNASTVTRADFARGAPLAPTSRALPPVTTSIPSRSRAFPSRRCAASTSGSPCLALRRWPLCPGTASCGGRRTKACPPSRTSAPAGTRWPSTCSSSGRRARPTRFLLGTRVLPSGRGTSSRVSPRDTSPCTLRGGGACEELRGQVHHDRADSSPYVFRSVESRTTLRPSPGLLSPAEPMPRPAGTVAVSNERYGRYAGELEIARVDLPADPRMNVLGRVSERDRAYLPYLVRGMGALLS